MLWVIEKDYLKNNIRNYQKLINNGNSINDTSEGNAYVKGIVAATQRLQDANDALEAHDKTVVILKEALVKVSE